MSEYWGVPETEYELSLLQFAKEGLFSSGYSVLSEKVEICSGAGALTMTAIIEKEGFMFGLYLHDGAKHRKSRGPPIIRILKLINSINNAEDLRGFVISNQNEFFDILDFENVDLKNEIEKDFKKFYSLLYNSKIRDLYETDLSSAADILRKRFRKVITEL